jgi:hypothetical protein
MHSFDDYYTTEDIIEELLRKELIGPVEEDETLEEAPLDVYSMGILWPQRTVTEYITLGENGTKEDQENILSQENQLKTDLDAIDDLDNSLENPYGQINTTNIYKPSSMAISMVVSGQEKTLSVRFKYGIYKHHDKKISYTVKVKEKDDKEIEEQRTRIANYYTRENKDSGKILFDLKKSFDSRIIGDGKNIQIDLFVRKTYSDGSRLVTVSVSNKNMKQYKTIEQNTSSLFQCHLSVTSKEGFLPLVKENLHNTDIETQTFNMLYRDVKNYATGHGCSVKWNETGGSVKTIDSEFMPIAELLQMESQSFPEYHCFTMGFWKNDIRKKGCDELDSFIRLYEEWLVRQKKSSEKIKGYGKAIDNNFAQIENCINRLKKGVHCLRNHDVAWQAFLYMNEAMLMQRVNYAKTKKRIIDPSDVKWYPFQMAYILQIIPDIVDEKNNWRNTVDLLWFPTGGGKTEAYLGLSAFVIFYRRLTESEQDDGVTIIMRYTLRLLTVQQFERASALICACEAIRRKYSLRRPEISIGLWVGMDITPNTLPGAKLSIDKIMKGEYVPKENPVQVFHCPFCGKDLDVTNYHVEDTLKIKCPNHECEFRHGLPVYIIDEDIYNVRPTLLLSTIDKFARIVWEDKTVAIFGSDGKSKPPTLIIQDELHLISGPLGSISGLYEGAIDRLCTQNGIKPKIIASTATVRNADKQIKALYDRESFQFPPYGIDINDSFFAVRASKDRRPARRYIGLCDNGGSILDLLVRVYGCLLFTINYLKAKGVSDEIIDQYFTVVGYFNSLKDLGSASTVIIERVKVYSNSLRMRKFKKWAEEVGLEDILIYDHNELTSRRSAAEIKTVLENLDIKYPDERAYSYILASNMLSVGVDISRLGIMTVYSQPKSNSEYIQATSRVGRSNPGMVLSFYNSMRSRDKSHYEQYYYYHQTFYKNVEPTSVTPFSYRAIEKALHSVYVALIRHQIPQMRVNDNAKNYDKNNPNVKAIKDYILDRVESINESALDFAKEWLEDFENRWQRAADIKNEFLVYALKNKSPSQYTSLLVEAEKENNTEFPSTLNSLRNVDLSSNVYLLERE